MTRRRGRHPAFEIAVFAAALLLAVFIGRELWRRGRSVPPPVAAADSEQADEPASSGVASGAPERSVSSVPRVRLTRIERRKPKPRAVPAP
jgi:hypothetical protein